MAAAEHHILCTASLPNVLVRQAALHGIRITVIPFIRVEPIATEVLRNEVLRLARSTAQVVFTSTHAVEAVKALMPADLVPAWTVHVVGERTRQHVAGWFGPQAIAHATHHADELGYALIAEGNMSRVIFFCGDQRLDTIPTLLSANGIAVEEHIVYRTIATPQIVTERYDAVLFLSPSAVAAYFSLNGWSKNTQPFAIGRTTAAALSAHLPTPATLPATPTREALLACVCDHFALPATRPCL